MSGRRRAADRRGHCRAARLAGVGRDARTRAPGQPADRGAGGSDGAAGHADGRTSPPRCSMAPPTGRRWSPSRARCPLAEGVDGAGARDPGGAAARRTGAVRLGDPGGHDAARLLRHRARRRLRRSQRPGVQAAIPADRSPRLLTVYAIVNAVTANLPAVQRVQILVDGTRGRHARRPRRPAAAAHAGIPCRSSTRRLQDARARQP